MRAFKVRIILVKSIYDSNVGATSRAMGNMGVEDLILISPKCEITYSAQQAAASGQFALQNRKVYPNWQEYFANESESIRLSFSARDGKGRPAWDCKQLLGWLKDNDPRFQKQGDPVLIDFVFGPEDWGLSNEDLDHCHFNVNIPTYGDNTSLNLAQAVLLGLFILRSEWGGTRTRLEGQQSPRTKSIDKIKAEVSSVDETLKNWILEMGFSIENRRINAYSVLRRLLLHNVPTKKELRILEIVLQQSRRKLREWKVLQKTSLSNSTEIKPGSATSHSPRNS